MKGKFLAFGLCLMAMATIGVVQVQTHAAVDNTRDCDRYSVIRCGTVTADELRAEYDTNNSSTSNGSTDKQPDIQKIFSVMGISRNDLNGTFKPGIVYQNGNVEVGGNVVATGAVMVARGLGGTQISGTNASKISVSAMSSAQTALVKFDQNGKFLFAVMKPCGNPVAATPPKPPAPKPASLCKNLTIDTINPTKFRFTANADVSGGATVSSYSFKVSRNGTVVDTLPVASNNLQASVNYTQVTPGDYTVRATVTTSVGDKTGPDCVKQFSVAKPPVTTPPKVIVQKTVNGVEHAVVNLNTPFTYEIAVTNQSQITLRNVVATDTAPAGIEFLSAGFGQIQNNAWSYTIPSLTAGETLRFSITAKSTQVSTASVVNTVCVDTTQIPGTPDSCDTASTETPAEDVVQVCNPANGQTITVPQSEASKYTPVGSPACTPAQTPTPAELPTTGITTTVMQVLGASSLIGASAYYIASRRQ
jgi:uncharacterized repeat protein (TIGR01451 family)/LPXTG-motif cell wall-anchored protein